MNSSPQRLFVTDFDGTMAQNDFYHCAVEQLLTPEDLSPWHDYTAGKITHFESLRRIFAKIRASEEELLRVVDSMRFDPRAADAIGRLRKSGWEVKVVSNGCAWYIERLFKQHGIEVELHTNPGDFSPEAGLQLRLPRESPFFSEEVGISKAAVVKGAIAGGRYQDVAFAGDGRPDLDPALLVSANHRFARGWLADALAERNESFHAFEVWSEIAGILCEQTS